MPHFLTRLWSLCLTVMVAATSALGQLQAPTDPDSSKAIASTVEWITREVNAPRVSFNTFDSAAAKARVSYHLYTPAAYEREPQRRFPVVYWLHGSGGGLAGIPQVARHFDDAIEAGKAPPCLVVFVNGLVEGMYVDWKDGTAPLESVIVKDLVPHIDATYRTIATREGRLLDGFSMGGYGAARLGFKFPEMFRAVSIVGAGPMQPELVQTPRAGKQRAAEVLSKVYGGDQAYFRSVSPRTLAEENAETITKGSLVRMVIGDKDETFENNRLFHEHLDSLEITHTWTVLTGVAHDPMGVLRAMGDDNWAFYRAAFADPRVPQPLDDASRKPALTNKPAITPGTTVTRTIKVGTHDRRSMIYIPRGYDATRPTPVIVVFHGGGGNPESMVSFAGLNDKADEAGFIVVYPYGTGRLRNRLLTFNGGNCCGYAMDNNIDDVGFTRAMLDDVATVANVDENRVFATGMSNGGIMAYRVASELADRIAAIAPVGGPMGTEVCSPSRPVAVMHFHGTADANAPFNGGQGVGHPLARDRPVFLSVQHSLDQWIKANGCVQPPEVVNLPDAAADGMAVTRTTWRGGKDGTEVVLIEINGGGHTWPGREPPLEMLGPSTKDISANDLMWDFFLRHARKSAEPKPASKPSAAGKPDTEVTLDVKGSKRRAVVVNAPKDGTKRPTVIALHGGMGSAEVMRANSGFDAVARANGFTAVYAEGTDIGGDRHAWNTGYLLRRQVQDADDIAYFDTLIDTLIRDHGADPARIYMTGGSNGGMMTFVYAVARPQKLAAIAPVVSSMFTFDDLPAMPVPILIINGAKDEEVPLEGGMSRNPIVRRAQEAPYKPLNEVVQFWVRGNKSQAEPRTTTLGTVTTTTYEAGVGFAIRCLPSGLLQLYNPPRLPGYVSRDFEPIARLSITGYRASLASLPRRSPAYPWPPSRNTLRLLGLQTRTPRRVGRGVHSSLVRRVVRGGDRK